MAIAEDEPVDIGLRMLTPITLTIFCSWIATKPSFFWKTLKGCRRITEKSYALCCR